MLLSYSRRLCLCIEFSSASQPRKWVLFTFCDAVAKTVDVDNLKQGTFIFLMVWEDSVTFRGRLVEQCPSDEGRGCSERKRASLVPSPLLSSGRYHQSNIATRIQGGCLHHELI